MYEILFITFGSVSVLFVILALFLLNGKGTFLISGYNTLSKEQKAKYDEKALCRFIGWLLIIIALAMLFFPVGLYLDIIWFAYCGIGVILISVFGAVIYLNTGNRFRKQ